MVEIFSDDFLRKNLAFRGSTALYRLYLNPAPGYSEDIDLVQIKAGSIGNRPPSQKEFLNNIEEKEQNPEFTGNMETLLRTGIEYHKEVAFEWLKNELIEKI